MLALKNNPISTEKDGIANSLGFGVHATQTYKALKRSGVVFSDDAKVVLHQAPAHVVKRERKRINILYTAWDSADLP